jgi:hypothetical protein
MNEFKKPNLKAPRYRPEVQSILTKEFFEKFKSKYPKYKSLDDKHLKMVIKEFNRTIIQTVVDTRDGVQLPELIGWLFIGTCQASKKKNVDFFKSKKYGVVVTNKNWDTDNKLAKIFYTNCAPKHKMRNREFWGFVACREFKRLVAKTYPENWNMYVVVHNAKQLKMTYQKATYKDIKLKETERALNTYNEFEL